MLHADDALIVVEKPAGLLAVPGRGPDKQDCLSARIQRQFADALEPVILTLQRIEDYEFAEQLSPEERENISRVIGKFVHLSKRRIQIDGFFAKQFFELVYRSEADLPKEFMDKVIEFEKSEKLNPPLERRAKQINVKDLKSDSERLESEANQRGIITQDSLLSKELNKLPLYSTEHAKPKDKEQGELFDSKE